jgi:hypothetical protein
MPCRGHSPAHLVALWADGRLSAHYYGWNLSDLGERRFEEPEYDFEAPTDLFGPGLAVWVERTFQPELLKIEPTAVWTAKGQAIGRRMDSFWPGTDCIHSCWQGGPKQYPDPCVIRSIWIDGSAHAKLCNFFTVEQILQFAWESLGVDIRDFAAAGREQ